MTELNGFKIDVYNQYNLPENSKYSTCPLCSNERKKKTEKCLMLDWNTGLGTCQHCDSVIQLHAYKKTESEKTYIKPEWHNKTNLSNKVVKYFEDRKISQTTLKLMRLTEDKEWMPQFNKEVQTIQFNYFLNDELINVKYRGPNKSFKLVKGAEKIFYNLDNIRLSNECIIVEGEIDCLSFVETGYIQTVSIPNGANTKNVNLDYLDNYYDYFENKEKVYLALDNDEPGQNTQKELIRRLGADKCYLVDFEDCKDSNEFLIKYGKERLRQTIEKAELVPLTNVKTLNDYKKEIYSYYKNGNKKGHKIGIESFDNEFSTYTGQYIVITGIPSHGKSDWVDQMAIGYCIHEDWKGVFCSIENDPRHLHLNKLLRKMYGKEPQNDLELTTESWKLVEEKINDYFYFIDFEDGYDLQKVLNKISELVKRKGIKYFVIDPFNKCKLKESLAKGVNDYTNDYLYTIDAFCRQYDVLGIIVAHPVKMQKNNGIYDVPGFYDIKGGGEWYDMSHHGLTVYRDFNREMVLIKVLKCKFQNLGRNGAEIWFKWNTVNGRFTPIIGDIDSMENNCDYDYSSLLMKKNGKQIELQLEPNKEFDPFIDFDPDEDPLPIF